MNRMQRTLERHKVQERRRGKDAESKSPLVQIKGGTVGPGQLCGCLEQVALGNLGMLMVL